MRTLLSLVTVGLLCSAVGSAQVVFDNFGANDDYDTSTGWTISTGSPVGEWTQGDSFIPSQSGHLAYVELAVGWVLGTNEIDVYLFGDTVAGPGVGQPDTSNQLETWHFVGMGNFGNWNPPLHGTSVNNPFIDSGENYWLITQATGPDAWLAWNWNNIGDVGPHAQSRDRMQSWSVANNTRGVFRIAIPEPASLALLGLGALLLRRR